MNVSRNSYYVGIARRAVEQYDGRFGVVTVVSSHISPDTFQAMAYFESASEDALCSVISIANDLEDERQWRQMRVAGLREACERGEISEDEYLTEAYCFI